MHLHNPVALLLLLVLIPLFRRRSNSSAFALHFSSPLPLQEIATSKRLKLSFFTQTLLRAFALTGIIIALARPQFSNSFLETEDSGRDIMLALDVSGSMAALDFTIDGKNVERLDALKYVINQFIDGRVGDRIGLVVFGDAAFTQCPLTTDHRLLKSFVDSLEVGMSGRSTALGDATAVTLKRLKDIPGKSKVIVLVTDGKNTTGNMSPLESARLASTLGIKVHTIGIGDNGYAPIRVPTIFGGTAVVRRKMDYDEKTLKEIAQITGGQYFNAKSTEALKDVYREIDRLEERTEKQNQYVEYEEKFFAFVVFALVSFVLHELLASSVFLRIP